MLKIPLLKIKSVCYIRSDVISKYLAWFVWRSNYLFELNISAVQFSKFIIINIAQ